MRRGLIVPVVVLLALCCAIAAVGGLAYSLFVPTTEAKPLVLINAPRYGERIGVGELVSIHAIARDEVKVTRVELWVDGELQEANSTNLAEGISPFPLLAQWRPLSPGRHTLTVRAFNTHDVRAHASLDLEAIDLSDRDGDGVSDDVDLCPDHRGSQAADGCPDRDGDGIRDTADACPDEAGLLEGDGCPAPGEGDRDGDGVRDAADACPDEAGAPLSEGCPDADWDGVADAEDACPAEPGRGDDGCPVPGDFDGDGVLDADDDCLEERGLLEHGGCPDVDGDGVRDGDDACLDDPGIPRLGGCPDRDGDGVADDDDLRPEEPGLPEDHGVPDTGGPDSDDDGIADFVDLCDNEEGLPGHVGCPPPGGAEDADGDGIADDEGLPEAPFGTALTIPFLQAVGRGAVPMVLTRLQLEVLTFQVSGDYDRVICYLYNYHHHNPATGELPIEPYGPYDLEGRRFDIAEYLSGRNSFFFEWDTDDPLPVHVECLGYIGALPPVALGVVSREHPEPDWDRDVVYTPRSVGGDEGQWFEVYYRICGVLCESVTLSPPNITHFAVGGDTRVVWQWEGNERTIDGFRVYVDGLRMGEAPAEARWTELSFEPGCERTYDVHMTAFRRHPGGDESPRSNTAVLLGIECPRTVRVTFQNLHTYDLPEDDDRRHRVGPLTGYFLANGARLYFDYAHHTEPPPPLWSSTGGWWLGANQDEDIARNFRYCNEDSRGGDYVCPEVNFVDIPLGPYDDLSLRAVIEEWDYEGYGYPVTTIFDGDLRLRPWEIDVGAYTIEDTRRILDVTVVLGVWDN